MPKSLWNARDRRELLERLERLSPDATPLWGRMDAPQMLSHLRKWAEMADGGLTTAAMRVPLRYTPLKQLIIYWLPWAKGVPTAPELLCRDPADWAKELAGVRQYITAFESRDPRRDWPEHPAFGRMSPRAWGVLGYRHTDHHFRQFGI